MVVANTTVKLIKPYYKDTHIADEQVKCKWVNDIFLGDLKVSGSLIRASNHDNRYYFEIGVGVNLKIAPIQGSTCI